MIGQAAAAGAVLTTVAIAPALAAHAVAKATAASATTRLLTAQKMMAPKTEVKAATKAKQVAVTKVREVPYCLFVFCQLYVPHPLNLCIFLEKVLVY